MATAADSLMDASYLKRALEDIMFGDPTPSSIDYTLRKYCSPHLSWANHEAGFGIVDIIPHIRSWRLQMVSVRIEITHLVKQGNTTANRHMTYFQRRDGSVCECECFQFITSGEDGMWTTIYENTKVIRNTQFQPASSRSRNNSQRPPFVKRASWPEDKHNA